MGAFTNSEDPDKMPHYVSAPKEDSLVYKGLKI